MSSGKYRSFSRLLLTETQLKYFDYPRPDSLGKEGNVKLYGDHFGFNKGRCKRCDKTFDVTFESRTKCDFHMQNSKRYRGQQQPHGCCGKRYGSTGCRTADSHVYKGNLYLDLSGYKRTTPTTRPGTTTSAATAADKDGEDYGVYALDSESIHTTKGLEVCRVTVLDVNLKVVYEEMCIPTSEIVDYNTIWSGLKKEDFVGVTKTFAEMQNDLLELFSDTTILVGHGLSSDLIGLKILHDKVVDTLVLYPHERGLPFKRALKDLASMYLNKRIQTGSGGHDSKEDAEVAMKLALRKT